ncbi:hypothetical protein [Microlunatus flavus]|nr:hypothetical protein [Microlunatus flavus]
MGQLRAYLLPSWALSALLGRPDNRELVLEAVRPVLPAPRPPEPLGPIFTRVPGTPVLGEGDPTVADVDRLLAATPVPADRARATWLLVEAVASSMAASQARAMTDRPTGLAPLGMAVPDVADVVVGAWTLAQARSQPSTTYWLDAVIDQVPEGSSTPDVVVFWSP